MQFVIIIVSVAFSKKQFLFQESSFSDFTGNLINILITFSTASSYSSVREVAQSSLLAVFKRIPAALTHVLPDLIAKLGKSKDEDCYKGLLFLLLNKSIMRKVSRETKFYASFLSAFTLSACDR